MAEAPKTAENENTGCKKRSEKTGINAITYRNNDENPILVTRNNNVVKKPKNC